MHHQHKNFFIDVTEIFCMTMDGLQGPAEHLQMNQGNTLWHIPGKMLKDWMEADEEGVETCGNGYQSGDLGKFEGNPEGLARYIQELDGDEIISIGNNPDLFISICFHLQDNGTDYHMECNTQHLFWVIHDLHHAIDGDVTGCEGPVTANIEAVRLMSAMQELWDDKEQYLEEFEVDALCAAFHARFTASFRDHITEDDLKYLYRYEEFEEVYDEEAE